MQVRTAQLRLQAATVNQTSQRKLRTRAQGATMGNTQEKGSCILALGLAISMTQVEPHLPSFLAASHREAAL